MARTKKSSPSEPKTTNGWDVAIWALARLFSAGYAMPIIALFGVALIVWLTLRGLESGDQKELILTLFSNLHLSSLGWILFFLTLLVAGPALKWMSRAYEKEIQRQREIIDRLLPKPNDTFKLNNEP